MVLRFNEWSPVDRGPYVGWKLKLSRETKAGYPKGMMVTMERENDRLHIESQKTFVVDEDDLLQFLSNKGMEVYKASRKAVPAGRG